nr:putative TRAP transporter small permease [uncultured bacterium]
MGQILKSVLGILMPVNSAILRFGRTVAWIALGLMVFVILLQVFCRYVLNSALPWPDEAARFLMLWMTGLIAPSAYRWGGFVAIDMFPQSLARRANAVLMLVLMFISTLVLLMAIKFGWAHTMGFGGNFDSSSLKIPLDWFGGESIRVKLRYMYGSLLLGMILLLVINFELILRALLVMMEPDVELPDDGASAVMARAD